jgi:ammonium transporter, Amt family
LCFGDDLGGAGILGNPGTFFLFKGVGNQVRSDFAPGIPFLLFSLFQLKVGPPPPPRTLPPGLLLTRPALACGQFAVITPALISGSFSERVNFKAYMLFVG